MYIHSRKQKKLKYFKEEILFKVHLEEQVMFTDWENDEMEAFQV